MGNDIRFIVTAYASHADREHGRMAVVQSFESLEDAFASREDLPYPIVDVLRNVPDYCTDCGHVRESHSSTRGCYAYDCPCQRSTAECNSRVSYSGSRPGTHLPAGCAALREIGSANGFHAGWGACRDYLAHTAMVARVTRAIPIALPGWVDRAQSGTLPGKVLA